MEMIHPPAFGSVKTGRKAIKRRPLQPRNSPLNHSQTKKRAEKQIKAPTDKENWPFWQAAAMEIEPVGASLAEELDAVRQRLERLRVEREKTDEVLRKRGLLLDRKLKMMEKKDEDLQRVQIEMDRILQWKKLRFSLVTGSFKTLREQEQEKRMKFLLSQEIRSIKEEHLTGQSSSCKASSSSNNLTEGSSSSSSIIDAAASISSALSKDDLLC